MNMKIIKADPNSNHFQQVAHLHSDGITEGFLSTLGISFLTVLYSGISQAQNSGVFIAVEVEGEVDGDLVSPLKVLGFIAYSQDVKTCYKQVLLSKIFPLSIAMIVNIFKLTIYKKVFETLLYPFQHKNNNGKAQEVKKIDKLHPELLSMAVNKDARGKGVGKLLVDAVDLAMKEMNIEGYYVVTHGIDERSNGFYQKCGFTKIREFENHEKPMNEYYKKF
jgi:ribosomal protein S18 acetylase RimI-like enzyme